MMVVAPRLHPSIGPSSITITTGLELAMLLNLRLQLVLWYVLKYFSWCLNPSIFSWHSYFRESLKFSLRLLGCIANMKLSNSMNFESYIKKEKKKHEKKMLGWVSLEKSCRIMKEGKYVLEWKEMPRLWAPLYGFKRHLVRNHK